MERHVEILRFTTAGSVDDGKSTLIGRLLLDSKALYEEQLQAVRRVSGGRGSRDLDLSLVTDGLKEEVEQRITIDVGYRYFSTQRRKFIIADAPGHLQYTRNMVTAASTANLAVVLVDATKGIVPQTRRHALIASLLRVPHLVVAVNKIDLAGYEEDVFEAIREEFEEFSSRLEIHDIVFIPISALCGDNVVDASSNMPWYRGKSLLSHLEDVHIASDGNLIDFRFPVQCVLSAPGYRAAGGQVASGVIRVGDEVVVLPAGVRSRVASLELGGRSFEEAFVPMGINVILEDPIEVIRGDLMARPGNHPVPTQDLEAMICWLNKEPLRTGGEYSVQHTTRHVPSVLEKVVYRIDPETLHRRLDDKAVQMNDIARVHIRSSAPLMVDSYWRNRATGSFILVDPSTGATVAAGMVL